MTWEPSTGICPAALFCLSLALLCPARAFAQSKANDGEGTIVSLDHGDIVLDLGTTRGLVSGDVVEVWRPIRLRHPVTGKILSDRFQIGTLKLSQVRPGMSIAHPDGELTRAAETGDIIVVLHANSAAKQTVTESSTPPSAASAPAPAAPIDPEAQTLTALFDSLRGQNPVTRISAYDAYVRAHPEGRYAPVLYEESLALRRLLKRDIEASATGALSARNFRPPATVVASTPLELSVEIDGPAVGAVLQLRLSGEVAYTPMPMRSSGGAYWSVILPKERVLDPGLDLMVEAITKDGRATEIAGTGASPLHVEVEPLPRPKPPDRWKVSAALASEVAYWSSPSKDDDRVFQTEGMFGVRFGDIGLRAARSGFGVYRGIGGTLHDLDDLHLAPRSVGLTYGYLEGEWGITPTWGLIARAVVGLTEDGTGGGGQGFLRIGNDLSTNLMLGGEVLGGIGVRGIAQLNWSSIPRVPIVLRTEVTNQPAGAVITGGSAKTSSGEGEVGARVLAQVGYQFLPELTVSARGSYEGRTITHAGPGFGGEVSTSW